MGWSHVTNNLLQNPNVSLRMSHKYNLECLDRSLRDITGNHKQPFGGISIILAGGNLTFKIVFAIFFYTIQNFHLWDFRQTLPIIKKAGRQQIINACLKFSRCWVHVTFITRTYTHMTPKIWYEHVNFCLWKIFMFFLFHLWVFAKVHFQNTFLNQSAKKNIVQRSNPEKFKNFVIQSKIFCQFAKNQMKLIINERVKRKGGSKQ